LFHVIKDNYARWILWPALVGVLIGNTIEAAADLGGMAAAINLFLPVLIPLIVVAEALIILALQISPGLNVSSRLNIPTRER
jgi:Mn2+/Fe2+ NRAMP family transporter